MSQFFNLARFGRLFNKHTTEYGGSYLLATGVLLGGIGLVLGFLSYMSSGRPLDPTVQQIIFVMGLLGAGSFFTSTVFALYGDKKQAAAALMLPASHWEKYLVGWLYSMPIFLATYVGCFFLIDGLVLQLTGSAAHPAHMVQFFSNESKLYWSLAAYAVVHALFLWGSIFFVKQHFVRTAFGVLLAVVVAAVLNFQAMQALVGQKLHTAMPFSDMTLHEGKTWYSIGLPEEQNAWFGLVPVGLMLLAWAAAYLRVTEKQI